MTQFTADDLNCLTPDTITLTASGKGKLTGKTFVVKDLIEVSGHVSSFGHVRWRETHDPSTKTSPIVTKLLNVGAAFKGFAKLDQLAGSLAGNISEGNQPINALYPDRFTGGSSSGSASAVAGGLTDFAIGTDTAGSIRVPAAACGLYGLRPTHDAISSEGVLPWADSFDVVGVLSKDPHLLAEVYKTIAHPVPTPTPVTKLLIAADLLEIISEQTALAVRVAAAQLANAKKLTIEEVSFKPFVGQDVGELFARIQAREVWAVHSVWITENKQQLAPDLQARMDTAKKSAADPQRVIQADTQARIALKEKLQLLLPPGVVLVLPVMYDLAPKRDASVEELGEFRKMAVRLNAAAGLAGIPEAVMPVDVEGQTYGVGILGCANSEIALLNLLI